MTGDALSAAGHPVVRTPYLDQLAGHGTRFSRGYSATPTCVPARVALMTGQSQEVHGRVGYADGIPFDRAHPVSLPRELRDAGHEQFFDLVADPHETRNLAREPSRAAEVDAWRAVLVGYLRDREEGYVDDGRLVPGRAPVTELAHVRAAIRG